MIRDIDAFLIRPAVVGVIEGYLSAAAYLGWVWVLTWLYMAVTVSVWNTVPAAITAVFWALVAQDFIRVRQR